MAFGNPDDEVIGSVPRGGPSGRSAGPLGFGSPDDEVVKRVWTPSHLISEPQATAAVKPAEEPLGPLGAGWKGMWASGRTGAAALQSVLGDEKGAQETLASADKIRDEIARRYQPKVPSYKDIRTDQGVLPFLGDVGQYAYEGVAQSIPQMGATALGAGAAALAIPAAPIAAAVAGGAAAALPFFFGENIQEQLEEGKRLNETNVPVALGTATGQGLLDTLVGRVLPGVGKAAAGGVVLRAVKKGVEGGAIESFTEATQQALQIAQANPSKLFEFGPKVQEEIFNAALLGGIAGTGIGAGSGVINKSKPPAPAPSTPVADEPALPPPTQYWPSGTGLPGEGSGTGLPEMGEGLRIPGQQTQFLANRTGLPIPNEPIGLDSGTGLPDFQPRINPTYSDNWRGASSSPPVPGPSPIFPSGSLPANPIHPPGWPRDDSAFDPAPNPTGVNIPLTPEQLRRIPNTGQFVFDDIRQQLYAAGVPAVQANAAAKLWRARYETLSKQVGRDAFSLYKDANVLVKGSGKDTKVTENTFNQDPLTARHYSALRHALDNSKMKKGTGQQWLNYLKKQGVKDEELVWTDVMDGLEKYKNEQLDKSIISHWFKDAAPAIYEASPHQQKKDGHYGKWTLGGYGTVPASNYREVVLSDESRKPGVYQSSHWPKVPNPLAHYRTTDRRTIRGQSVLLAEEFQSDWHQTGRDHGYRTVPEKVFELERKATIAAVKAEKASNVWEAGDWNDPALERAYREAKAEADAAEAALTEAMKNFSTGVEEAPFKETWPNLLFRNALMDAINQDKDYLAWPTGEQEAVIQGHTQAYQIEAHKKFYDERIVNYANKLLKPFGGKVEKIAIPDAKRPPMVRWEYNPDAGDSDPWIIEGESFPNWQAIRARFGDSIAEKIGEDQQDGLIFGTVLSEPYVDSVHAVKITPLMKELIRAGGLPLFQRKGSAPQGNITITPNSAVIRLFKTANPSTFMHESMHLWLEEMVRYAPLNRQIAFDLQSLRDWVGNDGGPFTRQQHEQIARGFEQYLRTGKAPSNALADVFKKFMAWLTKIYKQASDLKVEVPPQIAKVYDRLLAMDESLNAEQDRQMVGEGNPLPISGTPETYSQAAPTARNDYDRKASEFVKKMQERLGDRFYGVKNYAKAGGSSYVNINLKVPTPGGGVRLVPLGFTVRFADHGQTHQHERNIISVDPVTGITPEKALDILMYYLKPEGKAPRVRLSFLDPKTQVERVVTADYDVAAAKAGRNPFRYNPRDAKIVERPKTFDQTPMEDEGSTYSVWEKAKRRTKAFFDPFSEVPEESRYRDIRNLMTGGIGMAQQKAEKARAMFKNMDVETKDRINTYFETPGASPMMIPSEVRTDVVNLKKYINTELKQKLIDANLLPDTVAEKNVDSYLPRLYLKYILDPAFKGGARLGKTYAKKRRDMSVEELTAMGEVHDPGVRAYHALFRTERDLAVMEFLNKIAADGDWALPDSLVEWNGKKVTPYWLKAEAQAIRQGRVQGEESPVRKQAMLDEAARMDATADAHIAEMRDKPFDAEDYKAIPDTPDYGPLRGMVVRRQIADDIMGTTNFVNPDNTYDKWFGDRNSVLTRGISHWKALKVPMNLPSQVRNVVSNLILLNLSGIPIHKVGPRMFQAAKEMLNDGPYYQIAKKYGIGRGTFSEQELYAVSDELDRLEANQQYGFAGWRAIARAALRVEKTATDWHGKMEEWGKVAKIIDEMEGKGASENDAARAANKALFDYSEAHPFIKRMRQAPLGMPFITFQYKMIPLVLETLRERPTAFLPYLALAYTVPALVAAANDIDEDDIEKLRKSLSQNLRRKNDMYLLPYKDDAGRWQFVDVGYFMPWQMPVDVGRYLGKAAYKAASGETNEAIKDAGSAFKGLGLFSNPVLSVISALTTGVDPFTDRPIADKRDPPREQAADIVAYAWSLVMPSLLASYGAAGQLWDKETGTGINRYGEAANTYGQIAARALGVNTYPVVPEMQRGRNIQFMQREIQEMKSRLTYTLKDQSLTPAQRRRAVEDFKEALLEKTKELQKYAKESELSPKLRSSP